MDDIDELILNIMVHLNREVPSDLMDYVLEFKTLTENNQLYASYYLLDNLIKRDDWYPSTCLILLIGRYEKCFSLKMAA